MTESIDMEAFAAGNGTAWRAVYDAYWRPVMFFILRKVRDRDVAEDIAQACFINCYTARHTVESPDHLRNMLYRVATNELIGHLKGAGSRRKREKEYGERQDIIYEDALQKELEIHRIEMIAFARMGELNPAEERALRQWLVTKDRKNGRHSNAHYIALCRAKAKISQSVKLSIS